MSRKRKNKANNGKRDCGICNNFKESQDTVSLFRWPFWPFYKHLLHKTLILVPCKFAQNSPDSHDVSPFFISLLFPWALFTDWEKSGVVSKSIRDGGVGTLPFSIICYSLSWNLFTSLFLDKPFQSFLRFLN